MTLYEMSWTTKNGDEFKGQLFTAEHITNTLINLEKSGCTNITMVQVKDKENNQ